MAIRELVEIVYSNFFEASSDIDFEDVREHIYESFEQNQANILPISILQYYLCNLPEIDPQIRGEVRSILFDEYFAFQEEIDAMWQFVEEVMEGERDSEDENEREDEDERGGEDWMDIDNPSPSPSDGEADSGLRNGVAKLHF